LRRLAAAILISAVLLVAPGVAAESGQTGHESREAPSHEGGGHQDVTLWKWLNFAVLVGVLGYFMYKKAGVFFRSRTEEIQKAIAESARLKREAEERLLAAEARLANLSAEVEKIRQASRAEAELERERIRTGTEQEARKIQALAEQEIHSAAKAARQELKAYSAELAVGLAEQKIRAGLTASIDGELVESFLGDLDRFGSASRPDREAS